LTLVPLPELLAAARSGGYAVGYFESWDGYSLEAVAAAAQEERAPVILGCGCLFVDDAWLDSGGIETFGALGRIVADEVRTPVALLLNEARTLDHARCGLDAGFNAVMLTESDAETVAGLVREAHAHGIAVEGELPEGAPSDPDEAADYVAATGVDCLSVWFGNEHGREPERLDLDLLAAIHRRVDIPLVVHGGSGFPHEAVRPAIERGVAKFNVGTALKTAFHLGLQKPWLGELDLHARVGSHGPDDAQRIAASQMIPVVRDLIRLYGSSGRA
jgi:fructose/tagatose bisphosphate aldolase